MSNKRPDELPLVSGLSPDDIIIAETSPSNADTRQVVKIKTSDFLSGVSVSGSGVTSFSNIGSGLYSLEPIDG